MTDKRQGCARCRLDLIRFVREVKLPRFTMRADETWHLPQSRYQPDGSAELGGGIVPADTFVVEKPGDSRATGCACKEHCG